jgi:DNA polymerase III epsilon subunit family exonuclease
MMGCALEDLTRKLGFLLPMLMVSLCMPARSEEAKPPGGGPILSEVTFVAFDTETTGLKAADGRILEIAAVKFRNRQIVGRKSWLIKPDIPIPEASQHIHGITPAMVATSPPFPVVFREFAAFTEGTVLLAHNAGFDRRFMVAELTRNGITPPENRLLDTLPLYRAWFPGRKTYALEELVRALLPEKFAAAKSTSEADRTTRFHSALWDSECTAALFMTGMTNLPETATLTDFAPAGRKALSFSLPRPQSRPSANPRTGTGRDEPAPQTPQTPPPALSGRPPSVVPPPEPH